MMFEKSRAREPSEGGLACIFKVMLDSYKA
jgi:hypothetical protein